MIGELKCMLKLLSDTVWERELWLQSNSSAMYTALSKSNRRTRVRMHLSYTANLCARNKLISKIFFFFSFLFAKKKKFVTTRCFIWLTSLYTMLIWSWTVSGYFIFVDCLYQSTQQETFHCHIKTPYEKHRPSCGFLCCMYTVRWTMRQGDVSNRKRQHNLPCQRTVSHLMLFLPISRFVALCATNLKMNARHEEKYWDISTSVALVDEMF